MYSELKCSCICNHLSGTIVALECLALLANYMMYSAIRCHMTRATGHMTPTDLGAPLEPRPSAGRNPGHGGAGPGGPLLHPHRVLPHQGGREEDVHEQVCGGHPQGGPQTHVRLLVTGVEKMHPTLILLPSSLLFFLPLSLPPSLPPLRVCGLCLASASSTGLPKVSSRLAMATKTR